jgi:hypothetical protein
VIECVPGILKALGLIPSNALEKDRERERERERKRGRERICPCCGLVVVSVIWKFPSLCP